MCAVAEEERLTIAVRTKAALAAAKANGEALGGWRGGPVVDYRKGTECRPVSPIRFLLTGAAPYLGAPTVRLVRRAAKRKTLYIIRYR
jgi:DNA invertase Pin-like site-specific DNA recombinase